MFQMPNSLRILSFIALTTSIAHSQATPTEPEKAVLPPQEKKANEGQGGKFMKEDKGNKEAAADKTEGAKDEKSKEDTSADKSEKKTQTEHSLTLNGQKIDFTATAGLLSLKDGEGKVTADIFYIAYTKKGVADPANRPLTFSFNGGPGSSSVWMHLGLLGPKRVKLRDDGFAVPPPYQLVENEFSLLDETDLVFIDPVGTGYSRASKPEEAKNFFGVNEDARSIGEFIRLYITKNTRWPSPKFLIGESYGTTRAAALSGELLRTHRMNLNGIMLVSTVLNFQTIWGSEGNDLPFVLYLPSFTATAWYHQKLPADLQKKPLAEVLQESEKFTSGDYNEALLLGASLPAQQRAAVVKQMARFTGLSETFVAASDLRVSLSRFNAELLRDQRLVTGRFDSRYTSYMRDRLGNEAERDPSADAVFSAFASTFNHYVRHDLKFEDDRPYNILGGVGKWNWDAENQFANVSEILAESMTANPFLKVHVSNGFYDMATPYYAARYTFSHLNIHPELMKNITQDDYTAGHMMYLNLPDLKKQKEDLAKFIRAASQK
ncbi:S10 family peptidase [Prosthecobacter dejongeii]|uniref:Carboxypeptidase C (Cathepsin A) n=1 Tax=Prosthecobacter dejongeii TaxID=48465 RepID=A0A7W7YQH8_9BACT|nr:peptidase S10 [Prosthecobacter dejongeii]MBB5040501.1 carboxypeptidase C (cathepsin A) [Prosthecobacter dejongeii]